MRCRLGVNSAGFGRGQSGPVYPQLRKWPGNAQTVAKGQKATFGLN